MLILQNIIPWKAKRLKKTHNIFIAGCLCHIPHNAACKSGSVFAFVTGFHIGDHCVDFFYWFHKSSTRKSILKEYCKFCNSECVEFIKYVSTRWLCLEHCVNRELKKNVGLKSYFLSKGLHDKGFKRQGSHIRIQWRRCTCFFSNQATSLSPILTNFYKEKNPRYTVSTITCKLLWTNLPVNS